MSEKKVPSVQSMNESGEKEIDLRIFMSDFLRGAKKLWIPCLLLCLALAGGTYLRAEKNYQPLYSCSVTFTVQTRDTLQSGDVYSYSYYYNTVTASQMADTFPYILQSNQLQKVVAADLGLAALPVSISAQALADTNLFTLTVSGRDAQQTYDVLLSVMKNYPTVASFVIGDTQLDILNAPTVPTEPTNRFAYRSAMAKAALVGLAIGLAAMACYALMRDTIRTRESVRQSLNRECVGVLPEVTFRKHRKNRARVIHFLNKKAGSAFQESVRSMRTALLTALPKDAKVILITSASPGEGKTTVAQNLASSLGVMDKKVLLLDGDLRAPSVLSSMHLSSADSVGMTEVLEGKAPPEEAIVASDLYHVCVLAGTRASRIPMRLLQPANLDELMQKFRSWFDYIIIDSPPCGLAADASVLAGVADALLLVIRQDWVRVRAIQDAIETLSDTGTPLVGCVLNGVSSGFTGYRHYGYGHYNYVSYGYGYSDDGKHGAKDSSEEQG